MKDVRLLFPCSPIDGLKRVDEDFQKEFEAALSVGFKTFLFDHDELVRSGEVKFSERLSGKEVKVILRGWMLPLDKYEALHEACKVNGGTMITPPQEYEGKHYWPKAYEQNEVFRDNSPRCLWTDGKAFSVTHVKQFFQGRPVFVKDHVKSAKGTEDAVRIEKSNKKEEVFRVVNNMIDARGKLFERGVVFKEAIDIAKDKDGNNIELRAFFYNGRKFSVQLNGCNVSTLFVVDDLTKEIVRGTKPGFFTVDLVKCIDGSWKILECGDGQVSGLAPSETPMIFYGQLKQEVFRLDEGELNEHPLEDDYPVYWDYFYVADGVVVRSDIKGTIRDLKRNLIKRGRTAEEITSCDIFGRQKMGVT